MLPNREIAITADPTAYFSYTCGSSTDDFPPYWIGMWAELVLTKKLPDYFSATTFSPKGV
jgi:hypothetical protein